MYKVMHYKHPDEAKLIQRMFVWKGYGCPMNEDGVMVRRDTNGKDAALLYKHRTVVAVGFFESVEYLKKIEGLSDEVQSIPVRPARVPPKPRPKPEVSPITKVDKPADPFDVNKLNGPGF